MCVHSLDLGSRRACGTCPLMEWSGRAPAPPAFAHARELYEGSRLSVHYTAKFKCVGSGNPKLFDPRPSERQRFKLPNSLLERVAGPPLSRDARQGLFGGPDSIGQTAGPNQHSRKKLKIRIFAKRTQFYSHEPALTAVDVNLHRKCHQKSSLRNPQSPAPTISSDHCESFSQSSLLSLTAWLIVFTHCFNTL